MKKALRTICIVLAGAFLLGSAGIRAHAVGVDQPYSFQYDYYKNALPAPSPYAVRYEIDAESLGCGYLQEASGLYVRGDLAYICDSGNDRIIVVRLGESEPSLVSVIESGSGWSLNHPTDVFVTEDGSMYIADSGNSRVLVLDRTGRMNFEVTKPDDVTFTDSMTFVPQKVAVTAGGRIFVQASGVNRGLIEFSETGGFIGYMGASNVAFNFEDYIWKLISTEAQRDQMASFVPTEYNNIAVDANGFLFVTTSSFTASRLYSGEAQPVRRLNYNGKNILIENGPSKVIGALRWDESGPSKFVDVTALDNGLYYVLDSRRNFIYGYDRQGYSLYVFGGAGNKEGYFQSPVALEHHGSDLLVLDDRRGVVSVLSVTDYGQAIYDAITYYNDGNYEESYAAWQKVLQYNGNYMLAYDGIGKIRLRWGDYEGALDYLKYANDTYYYSKAWQQYRKDWAERNLVYVIAGILILAGGAAIWRKISREKEALARYEEERKDILQGS
ncbi:MAG: hypothetical protein IJS22_05260 [Lachnospiraceae bacterium]|nr:hypothetical protein [Lachnospiraceae bacterium]